MSCCEQSNTVARAALHKNQRLGKALAALHFRRRDSAAACGGDGWGGEERRVGGTSGAAALCDEGGGGEAHDQSQGVTCDVKIGTGRRLSRRTARELGAHR